MVLYSVYFLWLCCSFQLVQAGEKQKRAWEAFMHMMDDETYETLLLLVQGKFNILPYTLMERKLWKHPMYIELLVKHSKKLSQWDVKSWNIEPQIAMQGLLNGRYDMLLRTTSSMVFTTRYSRTKSCQNLLELNLYTHSTKLIWYIDLTKQPVKFAGKTFHYVLSAMDMFSRYLWLAPLEKSQVIALQGICKRYMKNMATRSSAEWSRERMLQTFEKSVQEVQNQKNL